MKFEGTEFVQREHNYAIVDEVDSILIDEARTPLIISGRAEQSTDHYMTVNSLIPRLVKETDFTVDEKARSASLTDHGVTKAERFLGVVNLYDPGNIDILHHVNQALKAHALFQKDSHYMVENGRVVIVDEFTGRPMEGRRYSDGLHQALEAKEGVKVEGENQTLASITYQNYFRMYKKLAGMTGTADTEAAEFHKIYNLEVAVIPTHRKMVRDDHMDVIYRTEREKFLAVIEEIKYLYEKGQPVLVGTISISNSERVSKMLSKENIPHSVLNAKHHEKEASIVAKAGQKSSVTISTNMAGRGTDIVLGKDVPELGGLFILGTERHESRRIDNQLRGRSGRQGDPGESRFYLSLEDDLMRIFGVDRFRGIMKTLGMGEGQPLAHGMISRSIENAQKQVESRNFDIRKHLLEYDDVMNKQREIIYGRRRRILFGDDLEDDLYNMLDEESQAIVIELLDGKSPEEISEEDIKTQTIMRFGFVPDIKEILSLEGDDRYDYFYEKGLAAFKEKLDSWPEDFKIKVLRYYLLLCVDNQWKQHLLNMDHLKDGIGLRGYAQKDPLREYQKEGFEMFRELLDRIRTQTLSVIMRIRLVEDEEKPVLSLERKKEKLSYSSGDASPRRKAPDTAETKVGRNSLCPCGSGKKYKKCCGKGK
jgi:preprotein translocase subunit SecA